LVWAIFSSSRSDIDIIAFEAPFSLLLGVSPRLADRAAPAAFCWAADLAGMVVLLCLPREVARRDMNPRGARRFIQRGSEGA
jgi:hypothetical protein